MGERQEREDQVESNVPRSQDRMKDTNCPSALEVSVMCMAYDMQMIKEKMDIMMNAMRGWVSTV